MSDSPKKFSRREFNLAGFSAGLATLTTPWLAFAQEQQAAEPSKKVRRQAAQQQVESGPSTLPSIHSVSYESLKLVAEIEALKTHLDVKLYVRNTSEKSVSIPHLMGGIPHTVPEGVLVLSQQKLALDMRLPPESLAAITRAASVEYLSVVPSGKDDIKTFYGHYISEWPQKLHKDQKRYADVKAKVNLVLTLDQIMPMTRTCTRRSDLTVLSEAFKLPKKFSTPG